MKCEHCGEDGWHICSNENAQLPIEPVKEPVKTHFDTFVEEFKKHEERLDNMSRAINDMLRQCDIMQRQLRVVSDNINKVVINSKYR